LFFSLLFFSLFAVCAIKNNTIKPVIKTALWLFFLCVPFKRERLRNGPCRGRRLLLRRRREVEDRRRVFFLFFTVSFSRTCFSILRKKKGDGESRVSSPGRLHGGLPFAGCSS
jgi:hypothetical protein